MNYLLRSINILNVILAVIILLFANYAVLPLLKMDIKYTLPISKKLDKNKVEEPAGRAGTPFIDYIIVAEQNPFHPERITPAMPVDKKDEKTLRPEIVLYGTVVSEEISLAYIEDKNSPLATPGRGNRLKVIRKGDGISGFILKEIQHDKIVMVRGEEKMTVYLTSPAKRRASSLPQSKSPPASTPPQTTVSGSEQ
ncbi:MAG: hypothetical protein Q8N09_08355 [Thermodesulfovibrionia bacterium]|nr:hypothetical protein [Thermodesulfovibrionia bacterium]